MGNLEEVPAKRKMVSLLYISIGKTARRLLMEKFTDINILIIEVRIIVQHCTECFQTRQNRTLDRHSFLSRKQKPNETLNQFWNNLNGLAARCEFGSQTEGLVHDIFILRMNNKQVQEKLCIEPKETPAEVFTVCRRVRGRIKTSEILRILKARTKSEGRTGVCN